MSNSLSSFMIERSSLAHGNPRFGSSNLSFAQVRTSCSPPLASDLFSMVKIMWSKPLRVLPRLSLSGLAGYYATVSGSACQAPVLVTRVPVG